MKSRPSARDSPSAQSSLTMDRILYFIRCMIGKRSSDFIFKKAGM